MPVEMTRRQAVDWLCQANDMLMGLTGALLAAGKLAQDFPDLPPPQAMLQFLTESWESLDSQYRSVYVAVYGNDPYDEVHAAQCAHTQEDLGTAELQ